MIEKLKLWWKQNITRTHCMQANNELGWECMYCSKKAKKWKDVYLNRWNDETKQEFEKRVRYY